MCNVWEKFEHASYYLFIVVNLLELYILLKKNKNK